VKAPGRPRLLSIAGSDSGGGAGIQADLKTFAAHGAYGMTAITALTAQNTLGVRAVHAVPAAFVAAQIDAVFEDLGVDAVKIGMLARREIVEAVADRLEAHAGPPIVLDPVMISASGDPLLEPDAVEAIRLRLMPLATVTTPNLPEAARLAGRSAASLAERIELARELGRATRAVLLKGAHATGDEIVDLLWDGRELHCFTHARVPTRADHGTGCTLSSALAARLAAGASLPDACRGAIDWLQGALLHAEPLGHGHGPVNHLWQLAARGGSP
jgi:hydroxymethylpyrimidine/phosphomethylpyrimidine kinase